MPRLSVKKVVVVCFLEAVKTVMDQIGHYRLEMAQRGQAGPPNLAGIYGDYRKLRDYLQRCAGTYPEIAEMDLEQSDFALLVAALRKAVEAADHRLEVPNIADAEREWLMRKVQVWSDWAVEFAQKPLLELPLPRPTAISSRVKALNARLNNKIYLEGKMSAPAETGLFHGVTLPSEGESRLAGVTGLEPEIEQPNAAGSPSMAAQSPKALGQSDLVAEPDGAEHLLDSRQIQDPRLRSLMVMDLRAYERARGAMDHRLAAVHLGSILEGALIDYALPRRGELGLSGAPDAWDPQEILIRVMGDHFSPKDRSLAYHLFMARILIRPLAQLVSPTVVTAASLQKLVDFVGVALRAMGIRSPYRENADRHLTVLGEASTDEA
ncbi:MAG: hypothetical protein Fur0037_16120 [Planctomycetota bacterium]